jgi:L-malate glycosyltransferase
MIYHIIHSLRKGGAERVVLELSMQQMDNGEDVNAIGLVDIDEYNEPRYKDIRKRFLSKNNGKYLKKILPISSVLRKMIHEDKPSVIFCHTNTVLPLFLFVPYRGLIYFIIQGNGFRDIDQFTYKNKIFQHIIKYVLKTKNIGIIVPNPEMRLPAGTIYSKDPSAVHVIPNGIDTKLFKPIEKEIDNQTKKIAVIGTIIKEKNVSFAIDVFELLTKKGNNYELIIVGDGIEENNIKRQIKTKKLETTIKMRGRVKCIRQIYNEIDLIWNFSLSEALPTVSMEAMSSGIPVFASNVRGNRELVINGENGYLFNFDDKEKIAAATHNFLNDRKLYHQISNKARAYIVNGFSIEKMQQNYSDLFQSIQLGRQ